MKQFWFFVRKEFLHVWRDSRTLFILFAMPLMQILIFGFALTNEVKNSRIGIVDLSKDQSTIAISERLSSSRYFDLINNYRSVSEAENAFEKGEIHLAIVFPSSFETNWKHSNTSQVQLLADATDPNLANTLTSYATAVIMDFQNDQPEWKELPYSIKTETRLLYNPLLKGSYSFVPGVMAMILLLVCSMMTSISIVREKELGTMEVILVSPIVPFRVVFAKMIPYFLVSTVNIASILILSYWALDVPVRGNLMLLILECLLFTITSLSVGLLISTVANSVQVAMLMSLMGMFLPTIMLSGFMFPLENIPVPLQIVSNIVPSKWFYKIVNFIMIKGVGFEYVWKETAILIIMTILFLSLSIRKFKLRLE